MNSHGSQDDVMERLFEMGVSITKKGAGKIAGSGKKQTREFARAAFESVTGVSTQPKTERGSNAVEGNHTPLDLGSLNEEYRKQDGKQQQQLEQVLQRLADEQDSPEDGNDALLRKQRFRNYKDEEMQYYQRRKKEKEDEKKLEEMRKLEEKEKEEEEKLQQGGEIPQGKERRSIFSKVKKRKSQPELRGGQGKS